MIQCNRCNLQHIGETKRRLKDRFNEHRRKRDNPNTKSKPTTAAEHFLSSPSHTANNIQLIPIEKIFSNRDSIRKAKEAFLISKGRTLVPHGLNICLIWACMLCLLTPSTWREVRLKINVLGRNNSCIMPQSSDRNILII